MVFQDTDGNRYVAPPLFVKDAIACWMWLGAFSAHVFGSRYKWFSSVLPSAPQPRCRPLYCGPRLLRVRVCRLLYESTPIREPDCLLLASASDAGAHLPDNLLPIQPSYCNLRRLVTTTHRVGCFHGADGRSAHALHPGTARAAAAQSGVPCTAA